MSQMNKQMIIYKITNLINSKIYIGKDTKHHRTKGGIYQNSTSL